MGSSYSKYSYLASLVAVVAAATFVASTLYPWGQAEADVYPSGSYEPIDDPNYMGWKGSDALLSSLAMYNSIGSSAVVSYDLYWPQASCDQGFKCLLSGDVAVIIGEVTGVSSIIVKDDNSVIIQYSVRVLDAIYKPKVSIPQFNTKPCIYVTLSNGSRVCEQEMEIYERKLIKKLVDSLEPDATITVSMPAWLTREAIERGVKNAAIRDVGSPFPLLNTGNTYVLFIRVKKTGYMILYDFVFGPYAYLIRDNRVYSLNYIKYPVKMRPEDFFSGEGIYWYPASYTQLRKAALSRYSVYGVPIDEFKAKIQG